MQTFPTIYKNAFHCFTDTFKKDGIIRGLYAGTGPSLVANISENAILFLFYGFCQKAIALVTRHRKVEDLSPIHNAFAGSGAAFFCAFALCPTELVKCRLQAMREMKGSARTVYVHCQYLFSYSVIFFNIFSYFLLFYFLFTLKPWWNRSGIHDQWCSSINHTFFSYIKNYSVQNYIVPFLI